MDAGEDQDISIKKDAPSLIAELKTYVPRFLWKYNSAHERPSRKVRSLVNRRKTDQLVRLLEPFQESPQLLDQHLRPLVEDISGAFIEYLSKHASTYRKDAERCWNARYDAALEKTPLPRAVSKILYILCKVRGQKIIVQLLNNEAKHMELMLNALEIWGQSENPEDGDSTKIGMTWEERFIMLLWLSHFMLAPFDLVTMASDSTVSNLQVPPTGIKFPKNAPPVAQRLIFLCLHYIDFASREREGASILLARLALRHDMRLTGVQRMLMDWALSSLDDTSKEAMLISNHALLGTLSFIAKFVSSADNEVLKPLLVPIYQSVQHARFEVSPLQKQLASSPIARKLVIKITRILIVVEIKMNKTADYVSELDFEGELLDNTIDQLLAALDDRDTSVRTAASKALSVIAIQLDTDMVAQIVGAVLGGLEQDLHFEDLRHDPSVHVFALTMRGSWPPPDDPEPSLGNVNPLKWHGLVLTLSHLIYRGSIPALVLYKCLRKLYLALSFQQRASSGATIGTNVRDAACFGLWSLARRYSTKDFSQCHGYNETEGPVIQGLANKLVAAATLDPAGNVRRGASAALQELIGRHPNAITEGIRLVEVVDYNAIALRSRAIIEVATAASRISQTYWDTILIGLLGWRGIASPDAPSRRQAAETIGLITVSSYSKPAWMGTMKPVRDCLRGTALVNIRKRHGLLLAMANIVAAMQYFVEDFKCESSGDITNQIIPVFDDINETQRAFFIDNSMESLFGASNISLFEGDTALHLDSPLISEAVCLLMLTLTPGAYYSPTGMLNIKSSIPSHKGLQLCVQILQRTLRHSDPIVVIGSSNAARNLFVLLDANTREGLILGWANTLRSFGSKSQANGALGATAALGAVFAPTGMARLLSEEAFKMHDITREPSQPCDEVYDKSPLRGFIIDTLINQLNSTDSIELKCATLRSLNLGVFESEVITKGLVEVLHRCLRDHTTNQQGDVGSLVRMEAIDAVATILRKQLLGAEERRRLIAMICGLAVEKLDKVRFRAWECLQAEWDIELGHRLSVPILDVAQTSTAAYFEQLVSLGTRDYVKTWVRDDLLEGYVTSAGAGSETVLRASREGFAAHVKTLDKDGRLEILCSHIVLIMSQEPTHDRELPGDRLIAPTLEFLAYLSDSGILQRLANRDFCWAKLLTRTNEIAGKTSNMRKLEPAIRIYAGCSKTERVRTRALKMLSQMLLHRFPKIRNAAADEMYINSEDGELLGVDWSKPVNELKSIVHEMRLRLGLED